MVAMINPFQSQQFHVPSARHDFLRSLSAAQGGDDPGRVAGADIPFQRMVDAWLLAVAIGRSDGIFTKVGDGGVELKAVTALNVLNNNSSAVAFLMHVAVVHEEDAYVIQDPARVVQIADGYAVSGFESIAEMIGGSPGSRVLSVSKALTERYQPVAT